MINSKQSPPTIEHLFLILLLPCILATSCDAKEEFPCNIALNKPYTISLAPNYRWCTDPGDASQLTDGKKAGAIWTKKSTVGWQRAKKPVEITIDLLSVYPISELKILSVGGGESGVYFPDLILALVSMDGKIYDYAGRAAGHLLNQNPVKRKQSQAFVVDCRNRNARFVKILIRPTRSFFFIDEIEVFGEKTSVRETPRPVFQFAAEDTYQVFTLLERQKHLQDTIHETAGRLHDNLMNLPDSLQTELNDHLESISRKIPSEDSQLLPLELLQVLEKEIGSLRATLYRTVYQKPFVALPANPMQILYEKDMDIRKISDKDISVAFDLWTGEYESAAINVINCSQTAFPVHVSISPLLSDKNRVYDSKEKITVRTGVFVYVPQRGYIADPLVLQGDKPFVIHPGQTTQIWLTFHADDLPAGKYRCTAGIFGKDSQKQGDSITIPLHVEIAPISMPSTASVNTCIWAYPENAKITRNNSVDASYDLRAHYTNVYVVHPARIPWPSNGKDGEEKFWRLLQRHDYAKHYLLFFNFRQQWPRDFFGKWMNREWKTNFSQWLQNLNLQWRKRGYADERFVMYFFDEELGNDLVTLAKMVKDINPSIKVYANRFGKGPSDFMPLESLVDIWSPSVTQCSQHPEWLGMIRSFKSEIWTYDTKGPGPFNDPYSYYRLAAWSAVKQGFQGVGFWYYTDENQNYMWEQAEAVSPQYGVIYGAEGAPVGTGGESVIPSRRWEAWREGIEDCEYLYAVQACISKLHRKNPDLASEIHQQYTQIVDRVLARPEKPDEVYKVRKTLVQLIRKYDN